MKHFILTASTVATVLAGCSGRAELIEVGVTSDGGRFGPGDDDGSSGALSVRIENASNDVVTSENVSCSGGCVDLHAVPAGGTSPYTYDWSTGVTTASVHVCPTASTTITVSVTDTGLAGEFSRAPQTVTTRVALLCSDGGASEGGSGQVCVSNPSFEGTPFGVDDATGSASPWVFCSADASSGSARVADATSGLGGPAPSDGATYLTLLAGPTGDVDGAVSEPLCEPMHAGTTYSLELDLTYLASTSAPVLSLVGTTSSCSDGQVLWSATAPATTWTTLCATFTPAQETTHLVIRASPGSGVGLATGAGELYVDHLVPVGSCPR